jgi:predicted NUDIX family NTP pyrophosphohydrolase
LDADAIRSNTFPLEWPPHSGRRQDFPEVDRAAWFTLAVAREKISPGQVGFLDELEQILTPPGREA